MTDSTALLLAWIPLAFLLPVLVRGAWLDARARSVGRGSEALGWAALAASFAALAAWLASGGGAAVAAVPGLEAIGVRVDALSLVLCGLVAFLGMVVLRFSRNYLAGDAGQGRFFKWMLFTLGSVFALALAPGLIQFWLAWVGASVGLHRLLVYFPDRLGTLLSARKKFVVSRAGDLCLLAAFAGIYSLYGTQDFGALFAAAGEGGGLAGQGQWICWLLVAGALLKSAQFPFHTWLPDTMGTPTPVSALMHAGIVNAGGYLVIRMSPLLLGSPAALDFLAAVGAVTAVFGSLVMLTQTGIKRALAYSTIAQMGFMLLQCGLGAFSLAMLHLVAHSLYKAHAFLGSGSAVAAVRRLESGPRRTAPPRAAVLWGAACFGLALVGLGAWGFGLRLSEKPGMLALCAVLAMAVTQLVWSRLRGGFTLPALSRTALVAVVLVTLYLALAAGAERFFAGVVPAGTVVDPVFQGILAAALFACFLGSVVLQDGMKGLLPASLQRALYVHALNGFYLNTLANRMARACGLVPPGR